MSAPGQANPVDDTSLHGKSSQGHARGELGVLAPVLGSLISSRSAASVASCHQWEQQNRVSLPKAISNFYAIADIGRLVFSMGNCDNLLTPSDEDFVLIKAPGSLRHTGEYMVPIMEENQAACFWYAVFSPGEEDPPVYGSELDLRELDEAGREGCEVDEFNECGMSFTSFWLDYLTEGLERANRSQPYGPDGLPWLNEKLRQAGVQPNDFGRESG